MPKFRIARPENSPHGEFKSPARSVDIYFTSENNTTFGAGTCTVPPGSSNEEHAHDDAPEIIYVIRGEMRLEIEGETHRLRPGDAVFVDIGAVHKIFNDSADEELVHTFTFCPPAPADAIARGYGKNDNFTLTPPAKAE
jgi:quercetin dioxygenase-like cupin family protein